MLTVEDIAKRFTYHPPQPGQVIRYEAIRNQAKDLATLIYGVTPGSREQSLAITALEECVSWANAAIARNEPALDPQKLPDLRSRLADLGAYLLRNTPDNELVPEYIELKRLVEGSQAPAPVFPAFEESQTAYDKSLITDWQESIQVRTGQLENQAPKEE